MARPSVGYHRASNRTFRKDVVAASHDKRFSELYEYDGVQRLKKFHRGELVDGDSVITAPTLQQGWQLDATGNWVNFTQGTPATPGEALDQQRAHNTVNEITDIARTVGANWVTPQHDRNGNTTVLPQPHDPTDGFTTTWDAWNRMITVSDTSGVVQTNTYDGLVRRISQATASGTERYLYTASWQTLEEHTTGLKRRYLWGLRYIDDLVLQDRDPTGTDSLSERSYALQDALFNVVALAQPNALLRERYAYTAYGRPLFLDADFEPHAVQESVVDERYLFTGRRLDAGTGLYYYRMRFYDWGVGRFLGRDPLGFALVLFDYQFVFNRPTSLWDPYGLFPWLLDDELILAILIMMNHDDFETREAYTAFLEGLLYLQPPDILERLVDQMNEGEGPFALLSPEQASRIELIRPPVQELLYQRDCSDWITDSGCRRCCREQAVASMFTPPVDFSESRLNEVLRLCHDQHPDELIASPPLFLSPRDLVSRRGRCRRAARDYLQCLQKCERVYFEPPSCQAMSVA